MGNLITAGDLAKIAATTKRTIHFYGEKGVLKPVKVNSKKYRLYEEQQVLDYQMILLLTSFGVSLGEIKKYLKKKGNLTELFNNKKLSIQKQIDKLQFDLNNLNKFLANLKENGTMVNPQIKTLAPFKVYYIEKVSSYAKIADYCCDLKNMFVNDGKNLTTLAIFENPTYQPKKSKIKIGVVADREIKIKDQFKNAVRSIIFNPGQVITYTHNGAGELLSLFWKELEKYCRLKKIEVKKNVPDFEIYRELNDNPSKQFFEIYLPIK